VKYTIIITYNNNRKINENLNKYIILKHFQSLISIILSCFFPLFELFYFLSSMLLFLSLVFKGLNPAPFNYFYNIDIFYLSFDFEDFMDKTF